MRAGAPSHDRTFCFGRLIVRRSSVRYLLWVDFFYGLLMSQSPAPLFTALQSDKIPTSHLPFSPAILYGDLIFVSGQASVDDTGKIVSGDFESEFRRSMDNLKRIVEAAGSDLAHVIQTRNYVDNPENLALYNRLYPEYFKAPFPARTTITGCLGKALQYEIEAIAVKKRSA
jgi:2-iminobutanoate/2-iminopropanoate deaminase